MRRLTLSINISFNIYVLASIVKEHLGGGEGAIGLSALALGLVCFSLLTMQIALWLLAGEARKRGSSWLMHATLGLEAFQV